MIPTYYINLDHHKSRRESLKQAVPNAVRISAFDGRKLNLRLCYPYLTLFGKIFMPRTAIGCALSHYQAVKQAYYAGHEYAVILEDDARPLFDDWQDKVQRVIDTYPTFDVVKLHYNGPRTKGIRLPLALNGSTAAYVISNRGMKKMLRTKAFTHPDIQLWTKQLTTWDVYKADLFIAKSDESTIRVNRPYFEKMFDVTVFGYMPLYFYLLHPMFRIPIVGVDMNIVRLYCTTFLFVLTLWLLV